MLKDLYFEIKEFLKGQTFDAILPPIIFAVTYTRYNIVVSIISGLFLVFILGLIRLLKGQKIRYALLGLLGILLASALVYISNNANNYFLPKLLSSFLLSISILISLFIRRPIAIYTSHLSRNWPIKWYLRKDVKPAYLEVTIMWLIFASIRSLFLFNLYVYGQVVQVAWMNLILGFPFTLFVLSLSYLYGIWRLSKLKGPSVNEFIEDSPKPWHGQKKGF